MEKRNAVIVLLLLAVFMQATHVHAQQWLLDFGSATGTHTSGESNSFLPQPPAGTARVRVGTQGGSIVLEHPGHAVLGTDSECRITAPTGSSLNKFAVYDSYGGPAATLHLDALFEGGAGEWYLFVGDGSSYSGNTAFSSAQCFTGLRFLVDSLGGISGALRSGSGWLPLPLPLHGDSLIRLDIYCNNTATAMAYGYAGPRSVAARCVDVWINGALAFDDAAKSGLADSTAMDSFMLYGANSPLNASHCRVDNIDWATGIAATPLPVELTGFRAMNIDGGVRLCWETASESNSYGFAVERCEDCDTCSWTDVGFVPAAGQSHAPRSYQWEDQDVPHATTLRYRLRQIDRDGASTRSPVIRVRLDAKAETQGSMLVYPNPVGSTLHCSFEMSSPAVVRLLLYSSTGTRMAEMLAVSQLPAGRHFLTFDCAALPRGMYYLVLDSGGRTARQRVLML
ncbi:MAG TPA: hypothetical protein PK916_03440 [Bacteroidota bacterium]|nr:hypothetical protein [Bacteroidota bacterium]